MTRIKARMFPSNLICLLSSARQLYTLTWYILELLYCPVDIAFSEGVTASSMQEFYVCRIYIHHLLDSCRKHTSTGVSTVCINMFGACRHTNQDEATVSGQDLWLQLPDRDVCNIATRPIRFVERSVRKHALAPALEKHEFHARGCDLEMGDERK
jgi:hypothetical protein